ncbi:hypothetical protein ACQEVF_03955 [Nonomuraea polychroma]|uniref:hypothetical protein n=1 Tax=Nonomuraea polychroma TaxID=46176 RepID=UPI003D908789
MHAEAAALARPAVSDPPAATARSRIPINPIPGPAVPASPSLSTRSVIPAGS